MFFQQVGEDIGGGPKGFPGVAPGSMPGVAPGTMPGLPPGSLNEDLEGPAGFAGDGYVDPNSDFLLRFCDFTAQEGHRYQYRIKLVLKNPNYQLPARYLKSPDLAKDQYLMTEPVVTPVVSISGYSEVLAGPVRPPRAHVPPAAKVILKQRDRETGGIVAQAFINEERGQLFNLPGDKAKMEDPLSMQTKELSDFQFRTNELLVDMSGGEVLPGRRRFIAPGELLVVDSTGMLTVRREVSADGANRFETEKQRLEQANKALLAPAAQDQNGGNLQNDLEGALEGDDTGGKRRRRPRQVGE